MSKAIANQVGDWYPLMENFLHSEDFRSLTSTLKTLKEARTVIYPDTKSTFRAFKLCPLKDTRVIILGDEPYANGDATGLAYAGRNESFSVPLLLSNIIRAVEHDFNLLHLQYDITLEKWAKQGILLLNTALTVEKDSPGSHMRMWEPFTIDLISKLSETKDDLIFVLWGENAQKYEQYIKGDNIILKAVHPDTVDRFSSCDPFITCGHFGAINRILSDPIRWSLNDREVLDAALKPRGEAPF